MKSGGESGLQTMIISINNIQSDIISELAWIMKPTSTVWVKTVRNEMFSMRHIPKVMAQILNRFCGKVVNV